MMSKHSHFHLHDTWQRLTKSKESKESTAGPAVQKNSSSATNPISSKNPAFPKSSASEVEPKHQTKHNETLEQNVSISWIERVRQPVFQGTRVENAQEKLQKSLEELQKTLDAKKDRQLPVVDEAEVKSALEAAATESDPGEEFGNIITGLLSKQRAQQGGILGKVQSALAKMYPVATIALGLVSFGADAAGFVPLKFAANGVTEIFTLASNNDDISKVVTDQLEHLDDYHAYLEVVQEARLDDSNEKKRSIIVGATDLLTAIINFLQTSIIYLRTCLFVRVITSDDVTAGKKSLDDAVKRFINAVSIGASITIMERDQARENMEILSSLSTLDFKVRHQQLREDRFKPTAPLELWILETEEFKKWRTSQKAFLWCYGKVGAGKTFLVSSILDQICPDYTKPENPKSGFKLGVACFYCQYNLKEEQTAVELVKSIIRQLVERNMSSPNPLALKELKQFLNRSEDPENPGTPFVPVLKDFISLLSSISKRFEETIIIIDALDECVDRVGGFPNREPLLNELSKLPLKLLVTSRDRSSSVQLTSAVNELEIKPNPVEIEAYARFRLSGSKAKLDEGENMENMIVNAIHQDYSEMFILVRLFLNLICEKGSVGEMRDTLKEAPPELYDFYNLSMKRIEHDKTAKGVLLVLLCARRRLHILEVKQAIAVQKRASSAAALKDYEVDEQILRECCAGLVIVDKNSIVGFSHESVREFLSSREKPNNIFDSDPERVMAWTCLKYLSHIFPNSGPCDDPKSYRDRLNGFPLLRYAAEHWGHHVRGSNSEENLMEQILAFLRQDRKLPSVLQALSISNEQDDVLGFPSEVHGLWIAAHFGLANVLKRLLKTKGTNVNILDSYGQTALLVATQEALPAPATSVPFEDVNLSGYEECVKVLLEKGADSNIKSVGGWTPLLVSAGKGDTTIVKLLLDSELKPNTEETDPSGDTALLRAAKLNHAQTVEALSDDADMEAQDKYGETALIVAARRWNEDTLRVLLDCGANLNARDRFGDTALLKAAKLGRTLTVQLLINYPETIEKRDEMRRTALIAAAEEGHHEVVELLLKNKAQVEAADCNGETALIRSVKRRHLLVVKQLLGQGASIETTDQYGDPPLFWAAAKGDERLVDTLLKWGPDIESTNRNGQTALMAAFEGGYESIVRSLVQKGASLEKLDSHGETALMSIVRKGREAMLSLWLKYDRRLDTLEMFDRLGDTPLTAACQKGSEYMVRLLLDTGADPKTRSSNGRTALSWATEAGSEQIVRLLLQSGVELNDSVKKKWSSSELSYAVFHGPELMSLLLEMDANLNVYSRESLVEALDLAITKGLMTDTFYLLLDHMAKRTSKEEVIDHLWNLIPLTWDFDEVADFLVKKDFDINKQDKYGQTLLSSIASRKLRLGWIESQIDPLNVLSKVLKLLDIGAQLSAAQMTGHTLLTAAITIPSLILVKACLERGEEPNERNGNGLTPLLVAAHSRFEDSGLELLWMLMEKGVDVTAEDPDGNTALDLLVGKGFSKAAKFLAKNGAIMSEKHIKLLSILQEEAVEDEKMEENRPLAILSGSETEESVGG